MPTSIPTTIVDASVREADDGVAVLTGSIAAAVIVAAGLLYFLYRRNRRSSRAQRYLSKQEQMRENEYISKQQEQTTKETEIPSITVFKKQSTLAHTIVLHAPVTNPIVSRSFSDCDTHNKSDHDSDDESYL